MHVIDKTGLAQGLLWDWRFDAAGQLRADGLLNQSAYAATRVLIAGRTLAADPAVSTPCGACSSTASRR